MHRLVPRFLFVKLPKPVRPAVRSLSPNVFGRALGGFGRLAMVVVLMNSMPGEGQEAGSVGLERAQLPLFTESQQTFPGALASQDYYVLLPQHVAFRDGSFLQLVLHPSPGLLAHVCAIDVLCNERAVTSTNLHRSNSVDGSEGLRLRAEIPGRALVAGWNRVSLRFTLHSGNQGAAPEMAMAWSLRRSESFLDLVFERLPSFPELSRFPATLTEEKLLRPDADSPFTDTIVPILSILIPGRCRETHLRATAIVAARLGQLGFINDRHCHLEALESWKNEVSRRDIILIARRDQLGGIELSDQVTAAVNSLKEEQGLVAEFVIGPKGRQRRVLLVSGADDAGLEKAALTVGSSTALGAAPPNPAVIDSLAAVSPNLEGETAAGRIHWKLERELRLEGPYLAEQSVEAGRLSPGFLVSSDDRLELKFSHSPGLRESSSLEVRLNGVPFGLLPLGAGTGLTTSVRLPLPEGLTGRDPMMLTFRATLDAGAIDCAGRSNNPAWLSIAAGSALNMAPKSVELPGVRHWQSWMLKDRFARRAAYLLASTPSVEEVRMLFRLWFDLGRSLPSSPILWPEVVVDNGSPGAMAKRLEGRSILLLGPISKWNAILPDGHSTALRFPSPEATKVSIQGRWHDVADFDPSLAFAQIMTSPWDENEKLVLAGGWSDLAIPALHHLLLDPEVAQRLDGNLVAVDALGRTADYELGASSAESFAETIQRQMRPVSQVGEGDAKLVASPDAQQAEKRRWSKTVSWLCGSLLTLLVAARLYFMWEQARMGRRLFEAEKLAGGRG